MAKIRMGIIGCGAIAQVQHMPNLGVLHALYEVTWLCDIIIYAALRPCLAFASRRLCHSTTMGDATNAEE